MKLHRAVLAWRHAVGRSERSAERGRVLESPPGADSADRAVASPRVEQVLTAAFQPPAPDRVGNRMFLCLVQLVQGADGDVVRGGDDARRQIGITEMVLDERLNADHHGVLPTLGRHGGHAVKPGCDGEGQQIEERRADPGVAGAFVCVEVPGQFPYQRGNKRSVRVPRGEPDRGEFPDVIAAHR